MWVRILVAMTKIDKRDFFSKTKSNSNLQPMIITKLYLHHFSMFETLHPPNSFLVFQPFYMRRLRHNVESRTMIGV